MVSSKATRRRIQAIQALTGFSHKIAPMEYLGVPIFYGKAKAIYFEKLLTRIRRKMDAFSVPKSIVKALEILFSNFIWGSTEGKKKRKWISWPKITRPTAMGGLGLRPLAMTLKAFRMKAAWNILNADTLWASFMRAKYIKGKNLRTINLIASASKSWRDIWCCLQDLVELATWEFGPGDFSVITENWRGSGSLLHLEGSMDYAHITLKEAALMQFNIPLFPQELQQDLREDFHLKKRQDSHDRRIWPYSSNGDFSIKSYITEVTDSRCRNIFVKIWQNFIPTKISFFIWKLLHEALPVDSAVSKCHIQMASRCVCCISPKEESFMHLFYHGDLAKKAWLHFNDLFDLRMPRFTNIKNILNAWLQTASVNQIDAKPPKKILKANRSSKK
ncbi:Ribonuclease h-like superfamily protein [Thalictrum thalictroides]|uniref:Ribonuclease h-like superfamily protein n=1 Tax=Thalictrum thalictroides TaxID=46969 RepID=A0A7J6WMT1_THATH|nr:Ribonuclease h-like superfamily protein [Thalictrum thalictroides]